MSNDWLRLWHDMPNDPKWRTIARISGQSIALVKSVYLHMLVDASQNVTRGHVTVTNEDLASALDVTDDQIAAVRDAMQGRVLEGDHLTGWEARQPKREDAGNAETGAKSAAQRKRDQRAREKEKSSGHAASRNVTADKIREDTDKKDDTANAASSRVGVALGSVFDAFVDEPKREPHVAVKWIEAFDAAGHQAYPHEWGITNRRMAPAGSDFTTANKLLALEGASLDGWAAFCAAKLSEMAGRSKRAPGALSYLESAYADHLQGVGEPVVGAVLAKTADQIAKDAARDARMRSIRQGGVQA